MCRIWSNCDARDECMSRRSEERASVVHQESHDDDSSADSRLHRKTVSGRLSASLSSAVQMADRRESSDHNETRRRTKRPPYVVKPCPEPGCGYVPDSYTKEERHRRSHTGEKPFACTFDPTVCQFRAGEKYSINAHIRTVHLKEKRYKCHVCPKTCGNSSSLRYHILGHVKNKIHTTSGCDACQDVVLTKRVMDRTESVETALMTRKAYQLRDKQRKERQSLAAQNDIQNPDPVEDDDASFYAYHFEKVTEEEALEEYKLIIQKGCERQRLKRLERNASRFPPVRKYNRKIELSVTASQPRCSQENGHHDTNPVFEVTGDTSDDDTDNLLSADSQDEETDESESSSETSDTEDVVAEQAAAAVPDQVRELSPEEEEELLEKLIHFCFIKHPDLVLEVLAEDDD